jgi:hypothetical protein
VRQQHAGTIAMSSSESVSEGLKENDTLASQEAGEERSADSPIEPELAARESNNDETRSANDDRSQPTDASAEPSESPRRRVRLSTTLQHGNEIQLP